jgi:thioredoxin-related protein
MLKKIPRPLFLIDHFFYPILVVIVVLVAYAALNADGLSLGDAAILLALIAIFAVLWWRFHLRQSKNLPVNATAMLREIKHTHKHVLLAFESEYCPKCMAMGGQVARLEKSQPKDLKIYRVSVNREPGRTLFVQFDGRITPTYVLLDPKGNLVNEWPLVLPAQRVLYAVNHRQEQQPT